MADNTTELEVLNQIVDVLGGQSGQYETVVPTLQQILALLGGGGGGSGSGYNPSLSVGRADALTGADETAQWAQRVSEGSGSAIVRSVQGAAVVWNQLTAPSRFTNNASTLSTVENVTTVTSTNQNGYYFGVMLRNVAGMISGHKYLVAYDVDRSGCVDTDFGAVSVFGFTTSMSNINSGHYWRIGTSSGANVYVNAVYNSANPHDLTGEYFTLSNVMLIDLTTIFGAGNEPATVAEFERMYPEAYYPYSAPTLKPVQIAGIRSTDAQGNALDSVEWTAQELWAVDDTRDELTSDAVLHRIRTLVLDGTEADIRGYTYAQGNAKGYAIVDALAVDEMRPNFVSSVPFQKFGPDTWCWLGINSRSVYLLWPQDSLPYETVDDFRAWLASLNANGTPLTFAYITSQPTTTPISPALPMTYRVEQGGTETIIVPEGEISAPPVLTIAEGESAAELVMDALACIATPDGPTATANHAVNTYLTMGGKLYKVTSAIAVGESITPNTNVTQTTVMAELIARTA